MDKEKFVKEVEEAKKNLNNKEVLIKIIYSWLIDRKALKFYLPKQRDVLVKDSKLFVNNIELKEYDTEFVKEFYYDILDLILRSFN